MKESQWFKGLKYAESQGAESAYEQYMRNEFMSETPWFREGVMDYVDHAREGVNNT